MAEYSRDKECEDNDKCGGRRKDKYLDKKEHCYYKCSFPHYFEAFCITVHKAVSF